MSQRPNKRKLTHLLVKRAKPRAQPYMIWDTQRGGLALRIEPTGHRAFKVVYRHHGRPRWYHLGAADRLVSRKRASLPATSCIGLPKARTLRASG